MEAATANAHQPSHPSHLDSLLNPGERGIPLTASQTMNPLIESVQQETSAAEWIVMTRNPRVIFWRIPRTKIFSLTNPGLSGIMWWNTNDEAVLRELHDRCKDLCRTRGGEEFCHRCHDSSNGGLDYWKDVLGPRFEYLRART